MKKHYVSLKTAKMLKEKRYNESCEYGYDSFHNENPIIDFALIGDDIVYAPELHEVQQWLREKYDINISVLRSVDSSIVSPKDVNKYFWHRQIPNKSVFVDVGIYYGTYELALEAGIIEALKMI